MGASLGETRPFACSCLPFPGPQRPIKGTLMEDDKRQPTPLLSVCTRPHHSVYPPVFLFCFVFWGNDQTFLQFFFSLPPSDVLMQRSFRGLKVGHNCGPCLQTPNGNILTPKPPLSFHFVSRGFKKPASVRLMLASDSPICATVPFPISGC